MATEKHTRVEYRMFIPEGTPLDAVHSIIYALCSQISAQASHSLSGDIHFAQAFRNISFRDSGTSKGTWVHSFLESPVTAAYFNKDYPREMWEIPGAVEAEVG